MRLISHRGNINGKNPERENSPDYILEALHNGYDVEIDIWYTTDSYSGGWSFGHDNPKYLGININDYIGYNDKIWFHCKNLNALHEMRNQPFHYFWHQNDDYTLTSNGYIWTFPNKPLTNHSICVLPEDNYPLWEFKCYGICSDFIEKYNYMK